MLPSLFVGDPSHGATTDLDGKFKLTVNRGAKLRISYVGYKTTEVTATDGMLVKLEPDVETLETFSRRDRIPKDRPAPSFTGLS